LFLNLFILIGLTILANKNREINSKELTKDSLESIYLSFYLATEGFHSMDGKTPSYFREPVISALNAVNILRLQPEVNNIKPSDLGREPALILEMTKINLLYLLVIYVLIFALTRKLGISRFLATCASLIPITFFAIFTSYITSVNSELPSAILLLILTLFLLLYLENKQKRYLIYSGVTLGLLALTKAVFLYVFIVFIPTLILYDYFISKNRNFVKYWPIVLLVFAFTLPVASWMTRNYLQAGRFSITERGGEVLLIRAVKNQMNSDEFWGGFYAYAPEALQRSFFEKFFGYSEKDLSYGGSLQSLNRGHSEDSLAIAQGRGEDIVSYLRIAQYKFRNDSQIVIAGEASQDRDQSSKGVALQMIVNHPLDHLKTSILYGFRGLWFYGGKNALPVLLTFSLYASLAILFGMSIIKKNDKLFFITIIPVLYFLFHAFFTHFIPRYSGVLVPILSVYLFLIIYSLFNHLKKRFLINHK